MADESYALAHKMRKPKNKSRIVIEGIDGSKTDPMQGVTDPTRLLKADTQRIDKNVYTPEQMIEKNPKLGGQETIKKI